MVDGRSDWSSEEWLGRPRRRRNPIRERRTVEKIVAVLSAIALSVSLTSSVAQADDDPAIDDPYWMGVPSGGFYPECLGVLATLDGYGSMPVFSGQIRARYSLWWTCSHWLGRPEGMMEIQTRVFSFGALCFNASTSNVEGDASATVGGVGCWDSTLYESQVIATARYFNPGAGNPFGAAIAQRFF